MEKRGVRLRKILIDMVRFWFLLILFAGLGAFVGYRSTLSYNRGIDAAKAAEEDLARRQAEAEAELAKDITEEKTFTRKECEKKLDANAYKEVMEAYSLYLDKISRRQYMDESPYLKMDPYHFDSVYLQFRVIHGEGADEKNFKSYVHAVKAYVNYNNMVEELISQYSLDTTARNLAEMISINDGGKNDYDDFLMLTIYQDELTKELTDKVRDALIRYGNKMGETYPGFSLELVNTSQANYYNSGLLSTIDAQRNAIISDQTRIENAQKKFSSMQKAYYNMLVNGTNKESVTELVEAGTVTKKKAVVEEDETPSKRRLLPMMILGAVAGVIVAVVLILLGNLLSGKLLSDRDFSAIYGVRSLGTMLELRKKGLSGKLRRAEYPDAEKAEQPSYLTLSVKQLCEKQSVQNAVFISTGELSDSEGLKKITEALKQKGITVKMAEHFPESAEAAEQLLQTEGLVLVERMHSAKLKDIDRVVSFSRDNGIPMLGAIGIAE
ncbi:MAG: hypothetical protein IKQ49_03435 [Eubacterium sp.]|nr:hypothetical protein [Eubacterium sp.]